MLVRFFIVIALLAVSFASVAQDVNRVQYEELRKEQAKLKASEDSLSRSLSENRKLFESGTKEQKKVATEAIVRLEGEMFDLRSALSRVANRISAIEQQYAEQSLTGSTSSQVEKRGFFNNDIFKRNLSAQDRQRLSSTSQIEGQVAVKAATIGVLYDRLLATRDAYDNTFSQQSLDSLRLEGEKIRAEIIEADNQAKDQWDALYNFRIDTYASLLSTIEDVDRAVLENVESNGREVRRTETLCEGSLAPQVASFAAQRSLLHTYEKAIASSQNLRLAADSIARIKPIAGLLKEPLSEVIFAPRVLTLYAPVTFIKGVLPIEKVSELPSAIIPQRGVYYSIQIALMSSPPKSLEMFKGAWPLQVEKTVDGKYRYMVGGFNTYSEAQAAVVQLQRAGYKAPVMISWVEGKITSSSKAKAYEAANPASTMAVGSFKIELRSADATVGETLRSIIEMHAKGKVIARSGSGKDTIYTIATFDDKYEAQTLVYIINERSGAKAEVVEIK